MKYNYEILMDVIGPDIIMPGEIFVYITPEIVPDVYPYYMVSNYGRVYHRYLNRIMRLGLETSGYLFITLSTSNGPKIVQMQRLVLMAFNPIQNPELYQANHKDGNKHNNYLYNLEWVTRSENILHSYHTGLHKIKATITEDKAKQIIEMLSTEKYQCKEIASILNVSESIVCDIKAKNSWKRLTENYEFNQRPGRLYSDNEARILCEYFERNPKPDNIASSEYVKIALINCGFNDPDKMYDTARKIFSKKHYTRISKDYNF